MKQVKIKFVARPITNKELGTEQSHGKAVIKGEFPSLKKFIDSLPDHVEPNRDYSLYQVNAPVGPNRLLFLTRYRNEVRVSN